MLLAFTGWMDGGDVSTGTVRLLLENTNADEFAHIEVDPFYILNFPGGMELASLFRPQVKYDKGRIIRYDMPRNVFFADEPRNLVLFLGKEPNMRWEEFGDNVLDVADRMNVKRIFFVGSFGGSVPHTREPRLFMSVSDPSLEPLYERFSLRYTEYEGPSSFVTYLMTRAASHGIHMASLVAEIPGYLQGTNPLSIEAVTRRLAGILGLRIDMAKLRVASDEWEAQVTETVAKDNKLAKHIHKLEEQYDRDLINEASDDANEGADDQENKDGEDGENEESDESKE